MEKKIAFLLRCLPFLGCSFLIGVLSLMSVPPAPNISFLSWDKAQHAGAYALLTFFGGYALLPHFRFSVAWLAALVSSSLYGALLELAQGAFTKVRAPEWGDLLADATGATLVVMLAHIRRRASMH